MRAAFWLGAVSAHILVAPGHGRRGDAETRLQQRWATCARSGVDQGRGARVAHASFALTASQLKDWLVGTWDALADLLRAPTAVLRDCTA